LRRALHACAIVAWTNDFGLIQINTLLAGLGMMASIIMMKETRP